MGSMSTKLTDEQQAEMDARWNSAADSLWPKLGAFAGTLNLDEQEVLGHLVQEALGGAEDTAGYWLHGHRHHWQLLLGPPPPPAWPAYANAPPLTRWNP